VLLVASEAGRLLAMAAAQLQRGPSHFQAKHGPVAVAAVQSTAKDFPPA